ncbi:MAG: aspartate-semialdehyde dehydrogenase [Planctomycetes bacterium]|nr:aspartate-semialdehyde dehydrogenase [Planctomycetota bacterium]
MSVGRCVAVVGATGAVGQELLRTLEQRDFPVRELRLLASPRSAGRQMEFCGESLPVEVLTAESFRGVDLALFSAGGATSREFAPRAVDAGTVVVDNSSAFRMDPTVPLVVPEVNAAAIAGHRGILANPNCSTILMVVVLAPLHRAAGLERVLVATYQAASGAGQRAMDELLAMTRAALDGARPAPEVLPHPLAFNLFPQVDVFQPSGYTREEDKMQDETRKILDLPELRVEATCVRVPVLRCHSEAVSVELSRPLTPAAASEVLAAAPGVEVRDDPDGRGLPQPIDVTGRGEVVVGRLRPSRAFDPGLAFWLVGDQLLKGAALNAVQIAELL